MSVAALAAYPGTSVRYSGRPSTHLTALLPDWPTITLALLIAFVYGVESSADQACSSPIMRPGAGGGSARATDGPDAAAGGECDDCGQSETTYLHAGHRRRSL
nr:hypothetical protein GCM10020092_076040 [Actinoplanes digitatis]